MASSKPTAPCGVGNRQWETRPLDLVGVSLWLTIVAVFLALSVAFSLLLATVIRRLQPPADKPQLRDETKPQRREDIPRPRRPPEVRGH
jgi:hypothetical protein